MPGDDAANSTPETKVTKAVSKAIAEAVAAGVNEFVNDHLHNTDFSRDTPAYNHFVAVVDNLVEGIVEKVKGAL